MRHVKNLEKLMKRGSRFSILAVKDKPVISLAMKKIDMSSSKSFQDISKSKEGSHSSDFVSAADKTPRRVGLVRPGAAAGRA